MGKFNKCLKARVSPPSILVLLPSLIPHLAKESSPAGSVTAYLSPSMAPCYMWNTRSLELLQQQLVSPPQSPSILLKSTRFLSLLLNAKLFTTSVFCTCYFQCLECVSFCFSHDWVFLVLQILTEMSLPQQGPSWPYYLKLVSPVAFCLCTPFPS